MITIRSIGTYYRNGKYGVWCAVQVPVGERSIQVDVRLTEPTMTWKAAAELSQQVSNNNGAVEKLLL